MKKHINGENVEGQAVMVNLNSIPTACHSSVYYCDTGCVHMQTVILVLSLILILIISEIQDYTILPRKLWSWFRILVQ